MELDSYDALWLGCLWIWITHPNGAIGILFKSCVSLRYAYSDTFGVAVYFCSKFICISICCMSLSHRSSGNKSSTPHRTDLKFPLKVCIPFSVKFLLRIPDVTNSCCTPFPSIFSF